MVLNYQAVVRQSSKVQQHIGRGLSLPFKSGRTKTVEVTDEGQHKRRSSETASVPETAGAVDDTLLLTEHQVDVWQEVAGLLVPLLLPLLLVPPLVALLVALLVCFC